MFCNKLHVKQLTGLSIHLIFSMLINFSFNENNNIEY